MWDDPKALRQLSNTLLGISLLLLLLGVANFALRLPVFPLHSVQLLAAPQRVDAAQIEEVVRGELRGNFFTVDLERARKAFEKLPWVRKASVRRHFPWQLEVELEEHEVLARWGEGELVNTYGEVFAGTVEGLYPKFAGQPDTSAEMAQMYRLFGEQVAPLGQKVAQVSLSPRHTWQLRLDGGMVLELGREQAQEHLARFVAVYPYSLATMRRAVSYVDLRYRNGFAAYMPGGLPGQG